MEVGQGPNLGCSAKEKRATLMAIYELILALMTLNTGITLSDLLTFPYSAATNRCVTRTALTRTFEAGSYNTVILFSFV
jgi:hypothetical protein